VLKAEIGQQVRAIYEERPYPAPGLISIRQSARQLPPVEWIRAIGGMRDWSPRRILVAGCGTGVEAFALKKRFPDAQIVGIDFSSRSIGEARASQNRLRTGLPIRFLNGDLTNRKFMSSLGAEFDLISCHGVLSYVLKPAEVLRNFGRSLGRDGVLYLGANGGTHFSANGRPALRALGLDLKQQPPERQLRRILRLCDALGTADDVPKAKLPLSCLVTDLFGPLIHNLPLYEWIRLCHGAGLSFAGHYYAFKKLRDAINEGLLDILRPWSRVEVYTLIDRLDPCGFHEMIFTKRPAASPPWLKERMLDLRPVLTRLYRIVPRNRRKLLRLESEPINTIVEIDSAKWEYQFLKCSTGKRSVRQILQEVPERVSSETLSKRLYLFYQLAVLNFEAA
jgi:SAM-dependent methyltransferase